jgi:hypothetical protein
LITNARSKNERPSADVSALGQRNASPSRPWSFSFERNPRLAPVLSMRYAEPPKRKNQRRKSSRSTVMSTP